MRLIIAAFFVYISFVWLLVGNPDLPVVVHVVIGGVILFITRLIYDESFIRTLRGISYEDHIENLLSDKKAAVEEFRVSEAITFEDLGTSCLCHFLRIGDKKIICLYGQYLLDYVEINDDPEVNQERSFPTEKFSLVRNIKTKEVMELYLGNKVINDSFVENVDLNKVYELGIELEDGQIIEGISFESIKESIIK